MWGINEVYNLIEVSQFGEYVILEGTVNDIVDFLEDRTDIYNHIYKDWEENLDMDEYNRYANYMDLDRARLDNVELSKELRKLYTPSYYWGLYLK